MTQVDPAFYAAGIVLPGPGSAANATGQIPVWNSTGWDAWLGTYDGTTLTLPQVLFTGHSAFGNSATIDGECWDTVRYAHSVNLIKEEITTSTAPGTLTAGSCVAIRLNPSSAPTTVAFAGQDVWLETKAGNAENHQYLYGTLNSVTHNATGTVDHLYCLSQHSYQMPTAGAVTNHYGNENAVFGGVNVYGNTNFVTITSDYGSQSTAGNAYGTYNNLNIIRTNSSGTDKVYGTYSTILRGPASGGTNSIYGCWSGLSYDTNIRAYDFFAAEHQPGASSLTSYFVFLDSRAVYRIKSDGVMAYYNPSFTKYTPDAADYERIIQQWTGSNVAQYGCEAGGTGTLRGLDLLGSYVAIGGSTAAGELRIKEPSGSGTNYIALKSQAMAGDLSLTLPAADGTGNASFLKSNGSGVLSFSSVSQSWVNATDQATITFDLSAGHKQRVTLGGNRTLALSNVTEGQVFLLRLLSDGTGRTVTWFGTIKWAGGSAPTQTATANKADVFGFICTSAGNYDGFVVGQNL